MFVLTYIGANIMSLGVLAPGLIQRGCLQVGEIPGVERTNMISLQVEKIPAAECGLTACRLADGIPVSEFTLMSPSGGNPNSRVCEHGWSLRRENSSSGVCLTTRRLIDGVLVGRFRLTSSSGGNSNSRACGYDWSPNGENFSS